MHWTVSIGSVGGKWGCADENQLQWLQLLLVDDMSDVMPGQKVDALALEDVPW